MYRTARHNLTRSLLLLTAFNLLCDVSFGISCPPAVPQPLLHAIHHLTTPPFALKREFKPLEEVANTKIPSKNGDIFAYVADPPSSKSSKNNLLILIHEFFGLTKSKSLGVLFPVVLAFLPPLRNALVRHNVIPAHYMERMEKE